ncbi:MAG: HIT family protein [Candidatus Diapherotrites archaeon]|nr:HIT family protein [Candidatus Diapherotrites archaeon]
MRPCFFCDASIKKDSQVILENDLFFSRFDDFPVSKGHCEVFPKKHILSFFDLTAIEQKEFFEILGKTKEVVQKQFSPDGFNIGINEGNAAGRSIDHFHCHLIPRYFGDIKNPVGGVRNILPNGNYVYEAKKEAYSKKCF